MLGLKGFIIIIAADQTIQVLDNDEVRFVIEGDLIEMETPHTSEQTSTPTKKLTLDYARLKTNLPDLYINHSNLQDQKSRAGGSDKLITLVTSVTTADSTEK